MIIQIKYCGFRLRPRICKDTSSVVMLLAFRFVCYNNRFYSGSYHAYRREAESSMVDISVEVAVLTILFLR
jgi:hypothetical protein